MTNLNVAKDLSSLDLEEFAVAVELHDDDDVDHNKELEINFKSLKVIAKNSIPHHIHYYWHH